MTVDTEKVEEIVNNKGTISFDKNGMALLRQTMWAKKYKYPENEVYDSCYMAKADIADGSIGITSCKPDDPAVDSAYIQYEPKNATIASVKAPTLIYSSDFSGCSFFLFRGPLRYFHGVHAHRGDGMFVDPTKWFEARGGKQVCLWHSKGKLVEYLEKEKKLEDMRRYSIGVLACINVDRVDVFGFIEQKTDRDTNARYDRKIVKKFEDVRILD